MKTVNIRLTMMTDNVKNFVSLVNRYPYDMDLRSGRYVVDAKSILGIFSIDLSRPIRMDIYSDNCDDLLAPLAAVMLVIGNHGLGNAQISQQFGGIAGVLSGDEIHAREHLDGTQGKIVQVADGGGNQIQRSAYDAIFIFSVKGIK